MSHRVRRAATAALVAATVATLGGLAACSGPTAVRPAPDPTGVPTSQAPASPAPTASPDRATPGATSTGGTAAGPPTTVPEPTTTNTLPPPPRPTGPAPSTAGILTAKALPVPRGWRTVALDGGEEEGFEGNGTWVHARDPRYAAEDVIGVGCAPITRDDYADPVAALEGNYEGRGGLPGVGLALQFADADQAGRWFDLYSDQVEACAEPGGPVRTTLIGGVSGLADHRRYDDGDWTEVARRTGDRVVLVILADPGFTIGRPAAQAILDQIR